MNRRFVNLLVSKLRAPRPACMLHRIDPASLFYPTGSPKPADPAQVMETPGRLPSAAISFDWPFKWHRSGWMNFMAFNNNIIAVDHVGRTVLYDSISRAVLATHPMQPAVRSNNMFVTVGDSLYVMSSEAGLPSRLVWFTSLSYGKPPDFFGQEDWYWRALQLPTFDYADDAPDQSDDADWYSRSDAESDTDDTRDNESPHPCAISAFTVVGDSQIWLSTVGAGTYSFDTVSRKWSKVGAWALPFRGRAVYVPEHNLWFAFSDQGYKLCAVDLALTQPVQHKVTEHSPPPEVTLTATHLLPLGSGKLCIARLFHKTEQEDETFAVVTGVEVRRGAGIGNLQMIKHKSRHYSFGKYDDVKLL